MRGRASSNSRQSACLRPALPFGNRCEHQQDSAVRKIGTSNDLLDPVENDGSGGGKQNFVLIGEQPTGRKSTAAGQTAEGVRQPGRQAAEIVEGEDVAVAGRDEQLPLIARQRRTGATLGSISARRSFERTVFADPCSPAMAKTG